MGSCYHSLLPPLDVFPGNDPHPGLLLHLFLVRAHDRDVVHLKADTSNAANNAPRAQSKKRSQNFESINDEGDTGKNNPWLHQNGVFLQTKESFNRYIMDLFRLNQKIVNFALCFLNILKIGDKIAIALKHCDERMIKILPSSRHAQDTQRQ